jgi:hypothetical protein
MDSNANVEKILHHFSNQTQSGSRGEVGNEIRRHYTKVPGLCFSEVMIGASFQIFN